MSRFYVGQRVRILWSENWPELAGSEGEIVGRVENGGWSGFSEWDVKPQGWRSDRAPRKGRMGASHFGPRSEQIEPLTPPHEACEPDFKAQLDKLLQRQGIAA